MLHAEEYTANLRELAGVPVRVTSYRIGQRWHCHIDNIDPGATISRADAPTAQEALSQALTKAEERLGR